MKVISAMGWIAVGMLLGLVLTHLLAPTVRPRVINLQTLDQAVLLDPQASPLVSAGQGKIAAFAAAGEATQPLR